MDKQASLRLRQACHYQILRKALKEIAESEDYDPYELVRIANVALSQCHEIDEALICYERAKGND